MKKPPYTSFSDYLMEIYGEKVYKIALNAGLSCPNRDGTLDMGGCIFCSEGGSGEFAISTQRSIDEQIETGKKLLSKKNTGNKFIAYFQAFTNTYAPVSQLRTIFEPALNHPDIVGISIATRPDCLPSEVMSLLQEMSSQKKLWIELGLQTIHDSTAKLIRRHYPLSVFDEAVEKLHSLSIDVVVHLILGLPGESREDMLQSVDYVVQKKVHGIKLQLLHVLKGTDLARLFMEAPFPIMTLSEYADLVSDLLLHIPPEIVIHRVTGDADKRLLLEPIWSGHKKLVLNTIQREIQRKRRASDEY